MKAKFIFLGLCFLLTLSAGASDIKYPVATIPKELKENARSVVRNHETVFELKSISNGSVKVTYAITILNKNGIKDSYFSESYNKFSKISGIKGYVYDAEGQLIKKIPSDEIIDHSAISGYSGFDDRRAKSIDPKVLNFPFTVEYTYEETYSELYVFPSWTPLESYNVSIEKSSYKAIIPQNLVFRYYEKNLPVKGKQSTDKGKTIYSWELINVKAFEKEFFSVPFGEIFPFVLSAPSDFEFEGYKGNLTTWENIGKWVNYLSIGKDNLNEETIKAVKDLVTNITDDLEKAKKVYEYMQNRTRYVSIQIGIGGLQPFDASTVHRLAYGDCKGLTNYLKALLKAVGIESKYCWVNSGGDAPPLIKEFPTDQFDHAFLCIPSKKDTIWIEATNQRIPFGFIGDFTDDRDVLLVDEDKSKIVHTKIYGINDNTESRKSKVKLTLDGSGSAEILATYKGISYDAISSVFYSDDAEKKRIISESIKFPSFQITSFSFKEHKEMMPAIDEKIQLTFENSLASMGARKFLTPNFINKLENIPTNTRSRKTDILIRRPFIEVDTIIYQFPITLKPESLPAAADIKNQFGEYHCKLEFKVTDLYYIRTFQLNKGRYPAGIYADFIDFLDKVSIADNTKLSLIKY